MWDDSIVKKRGDVTNVIQKRDMKNACVSQIVRRLFKLFQVAKKTINTDGSANCSQRLED